jgi:hypothetical protein
MAHTPQQSSHSPIYFLLPRLRRPGLTHASALPYRHSSPLCAHVPWPLHSNAQLFITLGIVGAQVVNYFTLHSPIGWRLSLGLAGAPALLLVLGCLVGPETPNSLVRRLRQGGGGRQEWAKMARG